MEESHILTEAEQLDIISSKLVNRVTRGKKVLQASEEAILKSLIINGKNLKEWGAELRVTVPHGDGGDVNEIKALEIASTDVAEAIQKAEYLLAIFELQASTASNFHEEGFALRYVQEMEDSSGKKIAAEKIKQLVLVDSSVDLSLAATQAANILSDFFKRIVKGLEETRKGLENRIRLLGIRINLLKNS